MPALLLLASTIVGLWAPTALSDDTALFTQAQLEQFSALPAELRPLVRAIEIYAIDYNRYPTVGGFESTSASTPTPLIGVMPVSSLLRLLQQYSCDTPLGDHDRWSRPYVYIVNSTFQDYLLFSVGPSGFLEGAVVPFDPDTSTYVHAPCMPPGSEPAIMDGKLMLECIESEDQVEAGPGA